MLNSKSLWRELAADARKISIGGYILVASLLALLAAVIEVANIGWSAGAGTDVPSFGYAAMAAGILFSLVFGIGLMVLLFYSSRAGYDEPARIVQPDEDENSGSQT
jgi:hypothetical protein